MHQERQTAADCGVPLAHAPFSNSVIYERDCMNTRDQFARLDL